MQRKSYAYVPGVAVLLTVLLAGCTGSPDSGDGGDDAKPGEVSASAPAAKPGRYRTLPEPCAQPERATLDEMLPGIAEVPDQRQREKAYEGTASATYDTDRRVGCSWKDDSAEGGVHRLTLDFERVVSYDARVSDDARAEGVYVAKAGRAGLEVTPTESPEGSAGTDSASPDASGAPGSSKGASASASGSPAKTAKGKKEKKGDADASSEAPSADEAELGPRLLDDLGDEAFLNDVLAGPEAAQRRTVTVVFRTSNALVTVEYEAQSALSGEVPDSKEMQDTARELARTLVGKFGE
ncbi:DUF3558 domain-containing protein [Streptomyces xanthii]|uniref:DUF3558 domain-containing protein n=1 Tax=Streptomyces xanthii TaxID=2768069 RepID=A0A7H1B7V8_9ACTN|nr:DUF3558 domain-containing protein [Streptomyces xanthii]QNS04813.1 DUF3558 domain-containing protein [Streptomyces xanthii]